MIKRNANKLKNRARIRELLKDRILVPGSISGKDAYAICQHEYSYSTVLVAFTEMIMEECERGKAVKECYGRYYIIPKDPPPVPEPKLPALFDKPVLKPWYSNVYKTTLGDNESDV